MENTSINFVRSFIDEIINIKASMRKNKDQLYFYQDFWNISLGEMNMKDYIFSITDKEYAKEIISAVMNGPYYFNNDAVDDVSIAPSVRKCFGKSLLAICFKDSQDKIVSLQGEADLCCREYSVRDCRCCFRIKNIIGCDELTRCLKAEERFRSINDVFHKIEASSKNIIILESARKSAKKHDFRDCLDDVFNGIMGLYSIELPMLRKGIQGEKRKEEFQKSCKLEISKESEETLNIERYKREREFNIPKLGKVLFDWHIKIDGGNTRIHYYIDKDRRKVYIGHCGKHLSTAGYKS
jgi:hypothetical protein